MLTMRVFAVISVLFLMLVNVPAQARTETIAAVVNDGVISVSDLQDRVKLVMASSGLPNKPDVREKIVQQVLSGLIEETIKMQEARRLGLEVTEGDVRQGFSTIAAQNKMEPVEFQTMLKKGGINLSTIEQQIRAQIAWSRVVKTELGPRVAVTDADVDEEYNRLRQNEGEREYLVAQIALPVESSKTDQETRKLAEKLMGEIQSGKAPFFRVAQQFSKAPGAPQGGDLGWISRGQLVDELDQVLVTMEKGSVAGPIRSPEGYHILLLREIRDVTEETLPSRDEIRSALGLQRLEQLQRRHYMDLKSAAFVEIRL